MEQRPEAPIKRMSTIKASVQELLETNAKYMQLVDPADRFELERLYGRAQAYNEMGTTTLQAAEAATKQGGKEAEDAGKLLATMAWASDARSLHVLQEMQKKLVHLTSHLSKPKNPHLRLAAEAIKESEK